MLKRHLALAQVVADNNLENVDPKDQCVPMSVWW